MCGNCQQEKWALPISVRLCGCQYHVWTSMASVMPFECDYSKPYSYNTSILCVYGFSLAIAEVFFFVVAWLLLKFSSEHVYILFIAPIEGEVVVAVKCTQRNGVRPPFAYGWWIKIAFAFGCRCFCFHIFLFRSVPSAHGRHTRARTGTVCVCNLTWSALAYALCGGTRFRIFLYGRWCGFVRLWQAIQLENIYIYI